MRLDRTFQFRGGRNYLHSTSVMNDLLAMRGAAVTNIDFKFHRRTSQQITYTDEPQLAGSPVAEWSDTLGRLFLVEREELISERTPYDEEKLVDFSNVAGRLISVPAYTPGFTRTDAIVAAFKYLLRTAHADFDRKYAFVRIRLQYCPIGAFEIRYVRDIGAFFQGDISQDGNGIGQIFFGVWQ
jgi:hypothetical protein